MCLDHFHSQEDKGWVVVWRRLNAGMSFIEFVVDPGEAPRSDWALDEVEISEEICSGV